MYVITLLFLGTTSLVICEQNSTSEGAQYIEYVDYDTGVMKIIDLAEKPDYTGLRKSSLEGDIYLLFTRNNPNTPQRLILNNASSILASSYNPERQTVVVVHGWLGNQSSSINPAVKNAYLSMMEVNVIVVDWSRLSSSNYVTASLGVPGVGRTLGRFLAFLRDTTGASLSNMHLVGFSLGAHVVGNAGNYLSGRLARITGLDPAGPMWGVLNSYRLSSSDAVYVEAIHTNKKLLGTSLKSGDTDFYPNGGATQPGCLILDNACSHNRAWQLFAATVIYNHLIGRKCGGGVSVALNYCHGGYLPMGNNDLYKNGTGQYRLNTKGYYPYTQI